MTLAERIDPAARSRMVAREIEGIPVIEARLPGPFRVLFTTRVGGCSSGFFSSLNLAPRSEDDPVLVERNRARVAALTGRRLVSPAQVHGLRVAGPAEYVEEEPGSPCDGLTVHPEIDKGLAALLLFADCVPVVLCGEVDMAVAHGGWRGVLGGIVQQAGRAMMGPPGTAVIGPSIGPCCFTVEEEVASAFAGRFGPEVVVGPAESGHPRGAGCGSVQGGTHRSPRVDLWAATAKALAEMGISPSQVVNPRICTVCNSDLFYSYRAEGPVTGRHGCVGWVVAT
jgi:copper oxidase (laccase) domain-containing protein